MNRTKKISAGKLDERISIEIYQSSRGTTGEQLNNWVTHAEVWANISYRQGSEAEEAMRETSTNKIIFLIRNRTDLSPAVNAKMRVRYQGALNDILYIREPQNSKRGQYLELICEQKEQINA